jgi:hypothetical protein
LETVKNLGQVKDFSFSSAEFLAKSHKKGHHPTGRQTKRNVA